MSKVCFVLAAGLDEVLLSRAPGLATLSSLPYRARYTPCFPAVTSTAQASLTTGASPAEHGIICNGLYTHNRSELHPHLDLTSHADARVNVSFWEQSNSLLQAPRFWQGMNKKVAMLFWQNSMPDPHGQNPAADIVLTPKPAHTPDGKTLTACWSNPTELYPDLTAQLGAFPLHNYWSPMAGLPSSQWIVRAAEHVWRHHAPDLQLVYIPHLDFNLMRLGPNHPAVLKDLQDIDSLLASLATVVRANGGQLIVAGDYGMTEVRTPLQPNLALRKAGLLAMKPDAGGKLLVDYERSHAFAMVDHQIAHLYIKPGYESTVEEVLAPYGKIIPSDAIVPHRRSGARLLLAPENAWFAHDWWLSDDEKPEWQLTVDIHNKPGFDPRELFFDRDKKCIAQNPALIKGSHGLIGNNIPRPVLMSDTPLPGSCEQLTAEQIAPWLSRLLAS